MNLSEIKDTIALEQAKNGTESAVKSLLEAFKIEHPNFAGILFREANEKNVVLTTEGLFGEEEKQQIRVPENLLDFPLDFVAHLLAHEFVHIEQRARPNNNQTREEREFEAYYNGIFPTRFELPRCSDFLKLQFCKSIERYFQQMTNEQKEAHQAQFNEILGERLLLEAPKLA